MADQDKKIHKILVGEDVYEVDAKYWGGLEPSSKQDALVSGTNIKTINGQSILGEGNVVIEGGGSSNIIVDDVVSDTSTNPVANKVIKEYVDLHSQYERVDEIDAPDLDLPTIVVDAQLSLSSSNPVENKVITAEINSKVSASKLAYEVAQINLSLADKQDKIDDIATIRSGAAKGATAVTGVKVNGTIKKPSSGTVDVGDVVTSVKVNGSTKKASKGVVDLGTLLTQQDIKGKQDTLVSGTNIKTLNNQSLLGSGNITLNVDCDDSLSETSVNPVQNKVITKTITDNERLVAAALNDLDFRITLMESTDVTIDTSNLVTKEEFNTLLNIDSALSSTSTNPVQNKVVTAAINNKADKTYVDEAVANSLVNNEEVMNLINEVIVDEEVLAHALNDLNKRLKGGSSESGVVTFYVPSGETITDEEKDKNKAAYDAFIATNGGAYIFVKLAQFTLIPSCFHVDSDLIRIEIISSVISEDGSVMPLFFGFASDGSITML